MRLPCSQSTLGRRSPARLWKPPAHGQGRACTAGSPPQGPCPLHCLWVPAPGLGVRVHSWDTAWLCRAPGRSRATQSCVGHRCAHWQRGVGDQRPLAACVCLLSRADLSHGTGVAGAPPAGTWQVPKGSGQRVAKAGRRRGLMDSR